jgi:hypothetical protein
MDRFETLYWRWRHALRRGPAPRLVEASSRLERFLAGRTRRPPRARPHDPGAPAVHDAGRTGLSPPQSAPATEGPTSTSTQSPPTSPGPAAPAEPHPIPTPSTPERTVTAEAAPAGAAGFDTDRRLTAKTAAAFHAEGFTFAVRYLSRSTPGHPGDLSREEAQAILDAGLALMAVQHVPQAGWTPTQALGRQYGQAAATNARTAGLPHGVGVWLDLEGVAEDTPARDVMAYCEAWGHEVSAAGYSAGLYVGADCGLNSGHLGALAQFHVYWRAGSRTPDVARWGYAMLQTIDPSFSVDGVPYDRNVIQADQRRRTPAWAIASPAALSPPVPS